ncbi:lectin like domain-containing protein [Lacrimispora sp. NSJ-141]|uniref:Lectin like domain-containing protein n=1 Tax=Lientehia hominis TaxID=2897778 RepID=A0AAP2W966_9FIRM|nr:lectin like domain-containing protein [Lientehia hominis]MCD2493015.1 lectin like domain-containing protein [Lientehia hominis]
MKLKYKWICRLISVCVLSVTLTGCTVPWAALDMQQTTESAETRKETEPESKELPSVPETEETEETTRTRVNAVAVPSKYDYREHGRCPAAGSQGELGTCWAFATMIALESSLLPQESFDFSEDHISLRNSFGMSQDMGGDYTMSMAYLLAWQGPVLEEDDPYGDGESPDGLEPVKHVQEIQLLDNKDYAGIKRAVYFHGGVQTSLFTALEDESSQSEYYNEDTYSYYYTGNQISNHDIVIVGWDDSYSRENFNQDPGMDGAFLCMNSWGTEFGDGGLFYVSYADTNIGIHSLAYTGIDSPDNYENIYQADLCGWLGQLGYGDEEAYFANVYRARSDERIEAAGFYATGADTEYEVYVLGGAPENGKLVLDEPVASGRFEQAGYYTVDLKRPVDVKAGERFAMAVRIRTPEAVHPVAIEYQDGSSEIMTQVDLSDGEGYISADGRNWANTEKEQDSNICLKAYTSAR